MIGRGMTPSDDDGASATYRRGGLDSLLQLDLFVPYRLVILANTVSRAFGHYYAERFDLTIPEWRVMAILGPVGTEEDICANTLVGRTGMDKVQVSRAVARMHQSGLMDRATDPNDRRRSVLRLTEKGAAMYREIAPAALAFEDELLETLSTEEQITLDHLITKLTRAGRQLERDKEPRGES